VKKIVSIVIALVVLVLGLWAGATYWVGAKAEQRYRSLLQQASQVQYLKFVNESYDRGFFGSKARTVIEVQQPGAAAENQPIKLTLAHDITHGPFPLSKSPDGKGQFKPLMAIIETGIMFSPETQSQLGELYGQFPEIASIRDYTVIYLDGHGEEHLLFPAFQHTFGNEDKVAVDWKGLSLQVNFTADLKGFTGSLSVPGLEAVGKDGALKIREVKSAYNFHEGISGLSLGEASFDLAGLEFAEKKETESHAFLIRGLNAKTSNKESGDNINFLIAVRTDQVQLDEMQYGPGVFEMEFRNLDAASLVKLQQTVRELQTQAAQQSSEQMQMMMLAKYGEILPGLLKKSPELEVTQLNIKSTDGDFTGKAKIAFDGTKSEAAQNLLTLANAITAQAEFKVAERLLRRVVSNTMKDKIIADRKEQEGVAPSDKEIDAIASPMIDEQLNTLMEQNILIKENGNYQVSASYKAGEIVLNGRSLSLQNLMQ